MSNLIETTKTFFDDEPFGLLLRVTEKPDPFANRPVRKKMLSPVSVVNRHVSLLPQSSDGGVWFSHGQFRRNCDIRQLILFSFRKSGYFLCQADFDQYLSFDEPTIPSSVSFEKYRNTPAEWANIPERVWVHIVAFKPLTLSSVSKLIMVRSGVSMDQQVQKSGFRSAEFYLPNFLKND